MITAKLKSTAEWKNYENCSLGISLQSRNHIGDNLQAIVDWTNRGNFKKCLVDLSDTLHRYNYMIEERLNPSQAHTRALNEGTMWLAQSQHILDRLNMPYEVVRWDRWMAHPKLHDYNKAFWTAFETNPGFKDAVMIDVQNYYNRRLGVELSDVCERDILLCAGYLLEELAVHSLFFEDYRSTTIYPGRQQASFKMVRNGLVPNVPTGMQNSFFVGLYLHKAQQNAPAHQGADFGQMAA